MRLTVRLAAAGFAVMAACAISATAKDAPEPSKHLEALSACQAIAADADRLACYDRESRVLTAAATTGELQVIDRQDVRKARRSLFGFSLPRIGLFGGGNGADDEDTPDMLESTIVSARSLPSGRWRITIAEGDAVWETADSPMRLRAPRAGDKVVFKKASLGSYFIRIDGQIGVKGRRVG